MTALAERLTVVVEPSVLVAAMAHRSWCAEHPGHESNERLEFLGDAVLGLVVTTHLFHTYPAFPEGELAKIRATVVSTASLAEIAKEIELGPHLLLGKGEDQSGGRDKRSILADVSEAVIGAVYLACGWEVVSTLVLRLIDDRIAVAAIGPGGQDYKTRLQELSAQRFDEVPVYTVEDQGPDHAKRFFATVQIGEHATGTGEGRSKKQAEQAAASIAWVVLAGDDVPPEPTEIAPTGTAPDDGVA